jgi:hypothetical protein
VEAACRITHCIVTDGGTYRATRWMPLGGMKSGASGTGPDHLSRYAVSDLKTPSPPSPMASTRWDVPRPAPDFLRTTHYCMMLSRFRLLFNGDEYAGRCDRLNSFSIRTIRSL